MTTPRSCRLVLQIPKPNNARQSFVIAATDDAVTIDLFVQRLLEQAEAAVEAANDVFSAELARIELEQLIARLSFALGRNLQRRGS